MLHSQWCFSPFLGGLIMGWFVYAPQSMLYDLCLYLYLYLQFSKNSILHPSSCSYDIGSGSYYDSKFNYTISELFMLVILTLSGIYVRVVKRQPTQKLGANGRDDGPLVSIFYSEICYSVYFFAKAVDIFLHHLPAFISYSFLLYISFWPWTFLCSQLTDYLKEGPIKISLSRNDSRTFCLGIRIAKRRSLEQVGFLVYSPLLSTTLSRFKTHILLGNDMWISRASCVPFKEVDRHRQTLSDGFYCS